MSYREKLLSLGFISKSPKRTVKKTPTGTIEQTHHFDGRVDAQVNLNTVTITQEVKTQ